MIMLRKIFLITIFLILAYHYESKQVLYCADETPAGVEFKYEGRDPFVSALPQKPIVYRPTDVTVAGGQVKPPDFSVQGMVWGSKRPQAIIEDRIYNIGDEVKGAKIVGIDKEGIKVTYQGNIFLVAPEAIKSSSEKK